MNLFLAYNYITQLTPSNEDLFQDNNGEIDPAKFNEELENQLGYVTDMINNHVGTNPKNPSIAYYKKEIDYVLKLHNGDLSERWTLWLDDIVKVHITEDKKAYMVESIACKRNVAEMEKDKEYNNRIRYFVNSIFNNQYKKLAGTSFDLYIAQIDIMERENNIITSFTMKDLM